MSEIVDTLEYRGFKIEFMDDDLGQQVYTMWQNSVLPFGSFNFKYKEDMKNIIDEHLDTITRFKENKDFFGAKLTWFDNSGYRDIKLTYRDRLLKVWTVVDQTNINLNEIIDSAVAVLTLYKQVFK